MKSKAPTAQVHRTTTIMSAEDVEEWVKSAARAQLRGTYPTIEFESQVARWLPNLGIEVTTQYKLPR